ncbi:hypothetical protein NE237_002109 [Protea cynaroides]|uniref:Uncharacterized protein n=1 Tax=Protea cynaroides TaxID=273540 RepID=A0A9Q0KUC9_9MAGN|nr:hypothetical protein NE237_002109 [Protea cynaroides]
MLMFFNYGQSSSNVCFLSSFLNEDCRKPLNPPSPKVRFEAPYLSISHCLCSNNGGKGDVLPFDPESETLQELKLRHSTTTTSPLSSFTLQLQSRFAFLTEFHLDSRILKLRI